MATKHFFKILTLFILMIVLGLAGVFYVNRLEAEKKEAAAVNAKNVKPQAQTPPKPCVGKNC